MAASGSYAYDPSLSDIGIDAFERCGIRVASLTADQMVSLRRSMNSVLVRWSNRAINLWSVDLQVIPLVQGVVTYDIPTSTVTMLETYIRNYQLGATVDFAPAFATTVASKVVTITLANNGFEVGGWISVVIPVSIGGIIVFGFYQVASVIDDNTFTILAGDAAATLASGGVVPLFDTTADTATVGVTLPNHGYLPGDAFIVQVQTVVGGITLLGTYTINTVVSADQFTFLAYYNAGQTDSGDENDGNAQIAGQDNAQEPVDRLITPISRTDYAAISAKFFQGGVTSYYYDRQINPKVTIWLAPDGNGPYELRYYRMAQMMTATPAGLETGGFPYRFIEAFTAEVAAHLAMKWVPDKMDVLSAYAKDAWAEASYEDRERVTLSIYPALGSYFS